MDNTNEDRRFVFHGNLVLPQLRILDFSNPIEPVKILNWILGIDYAYNMYIN